MLFRKKRKSSGFKSSVVSGFWHGTPGHSLSKGMQGASSAMCVPVDIFQTLSCETIPRKGEKKNTQMEICPLCIQKLAARNVLRGQF